MSIAKQKQVRIPVSLNYFVGDRQVNIVLSAILLWTKKSTVKVDVTIGAGQA